jgi:hypothetical protein
MIFLRRIKGCLCDVDFIYLRFVRFGGILPPRFQPSLTGLVAVGMYTQDCPGFPVRGSR